MGRAGPNSQPLEPFCRLAWGHFDRSQRAANRLGGAVATFFRENSLSPCLTPPLWREKIEPDLCPAGRLRVVSPVRLAVPEAHLCQFAVSGRSPFGRAKWRTPAERFPRTNRRPPRTWPARPTSRRSNGWCASRCVQCNAPRDLPALSIHAPLPIARITLPHDA